MALLDLSSRGIRGWKTCTVFSITSWGLTVWRISFWSGNDGGGVVELQTAGLGVRVIIPKNSGALDWTRGDFESKGFEPQEIIKAAPLLMTRWMG
jgi:hypothetical protein